MEHIKLMVKFLTDEELENELHKAFESKNDELAEIICIEEFMRKLKQMEGEE